MMLAANVSRLMNFPDRGSRQESKSVLQCLWSARSRGNLSTTNNFSRSSNKVMKLPLGNLLPVSNSQSQSHHCSNCMQAPYILRAISSTSTNFIGWFSKFRGLSGLLMATSKGPHTHPHTATHPHHTHTLHTPTRTKGSELGKCAYLRSKKKFCAFRRMASCRRTTKIQWVSGERMLGIYMHTIYIFTHSHTGQLKRKCKVRLTIRQKTSW